MFLYVELWKARPEWYALSKEERTEYMSESGPAIQELLEKGIELVGFGLNEVETPHRADYRYLSVWKIPEKKLVMQMESAVEKAGWHEYFEQANVRGWFVTPEAVLSDMINLEEGSSKSVDIDVSSQYDN